MCNCDCAKRLRELEDIRKRQQCREWAQEHMNIYSIPLTDSLAKQVARNQYGREEAERLFPNIA